jgi:hypothetical protein
VLCKNKKENKCIQFYSILFYFIGTDDCGVISGEKSGEKGAFSALHKLLRSGIPGLESMFSQARAPNNTVHHAIDY